MNGLKTGDKVRHKYNRDLGPGEVVTVEARRIHVHFPRGGETIQFSLDDHGLAPFRVPSGADAERWFETSALDVVDRLARLEADDLASWENRLDGLRLARVRESGGLGSFLGGRIRLFPHQLHVAEQASQADPVRWLLADEVGLGKTVEACLIMNRLLRTGRAERVVVVAPASLTVQWLGELYRKFHQNFVLLDDARLKDVRRDFGSAMNPFDVHPRSVVALEELVHRPDLGDYAAASEPDLLVVDEAHHLERLPGHPGSAAYRAVAPLCASSRHALLLTAAPLDADVHGFFRLLELLRPDVFGSWQAFQTRLDARDPLHPCVSATRREDIGGLPPRVPRPIHLPPWPEMDRLTTKIHKKAASTALEERRRADALERALHAPLGRGDLRLEWIIETEPAWREAEEKMLIFVHDRAALTFIKNEIEAATRRRVAVFHEDMSPAARDLEVAQFALPAGPHLLISTEAGGEGRNFEFCKGIVLFDLPWDPVLVEQRIGRLDRISREIPVEIWYFVPTSGLGAQVVRLYESLGIFAQPLGGLDRSLGSVRASLVASLNSPVPELDDAAIIRETHEARERVRRGLYQDLHRDRYRPELAGGILSRIPDELETLTSQVVLDACQQYGFEVEPKRGVDSWYIEFGSEATVDHVPGVAEGSRWLGTFDREEAVSRETVDFFASGHPLVEGILMELEDGHRGEVVLLDIADSGCSDLGLLAFVKRDAEARPVILDLAGTRRPDWEPLVLGEAAARRPADPADWGLAEGAEERQVWDSRVRELLEPLESEGKLMAVAGFRLLP